MSVHNLIQTGTTCKNYTYIPGVMFKNIINSFNCAHISPVLFPHSPVMAVFLEGLAQFKILMEVLRNYLKKIIQIQMEHRYKN